MVFEFEDYKAFIRSKIEENRGERAYQTRLASAMRCQRSFLSQVLNTEVHLTVDHAASLCGYWKLSEDETVYFIDLVLLARAGSPDLAQFLRERMQKTRKSNLPQVDAQPWTTISDQSESVVYHSSWYWAAIHLIVECPGYQTSESIAARLGIPVKKVEATLQWLSDRGFITSSDGKWVHTEKKFIYLPRDSSMRETSLLHWRMKGMGNIQSHDESALHCTTMMTMDEETFARLKSLMAMQLRAQSEFVKDAPPHDIYCINVEAFRV